MSKKNQRDQINSRNKETAEDPARLSREFRSREHMAYVGQAKRGVEDREELCRHLRPKYRDVVMLEKSAA